jgi:hypothetical protein
VLVKASNVNYDTTWATITGTLVYQGSWNASTNTPTLTSSVGTNGYYYVVGTSGSTNLNGITDWVVGDWAIFNGSVWQKIDNTDLVSSVNGQTGVVVLTASSVGALAIANNLSDLTSNATARTNLGLGSIATQDANSVSITGGSITGITDLAVADGGTGASTLTGYVKGSGTTPLTASATIPSGDITGLGTMSTQNANSVAITGGTINGTSIGATTPSTVRATTLVVNDNTTLGSSNSDTINFVGRVNSDFDPATDNTYDLGRVGHEWRDLYLDGTANIDNLIADTVAITGGTIDNTVIGGTTPAAGTFTTLTATGQTSLGGDTSNPSFRANAVSGVTRWIEASGSVSGTPQFSASSTGSATGINFVTRGASGFNFSTNTSASTVQLAVSHTASAVNYVQVTGAATTKAVIQSSQGSDSNISFVTQTKGTGAIDLAAGSSGVNISNGGTVTALTITNNGSLYNPSGPAVSITAPTTAGGVQATASVTNMNTSGTPTVVSGGTGYTNGDTLTIAGTSATLTVTGVSGGVITSVASGNFIPVSLASIPANPASVTGGTGSGATFTILWKPLALTITNAGSGYVEQPTVTFSGGGGSGAAAYATVGSGTVVRSIGSNLGLYTPSGLQLLVNDGGGNGANYWRFSGAGTNSGIQVLANGSDTNVSALYSTKGASAHTFYTNNFAQGQFQVSHTASAVNYVQVTGGATGVAPTISSQGSDANVDMFVASKGSAWIYFRTAGTTTQAIVKHTASAVNRLTFTGATAGNAPTISLDGSDTNIDLTLTPKGTGNVRFGTFTANMGLVVQGYIEVKDSGGTVRRLAVIA